MGKAQPKDTYSAATDESTCRSTVELMTSLNNILLEISKCSVLDSGEFACASHRLVTAACEGLKVKRASIWLLDEEDSLIRCVILQDEKLGLSREPIELTQEQFPRYFRALHEDRNIVAEDARTHPDTSEFTETYLDPLSIGALLDTPVRLEGKMVGVLCCEHVGSCRPWSIPEQTFAGMLGDLIGKALTSECRRKAEEELRKTNEELEHRVKERTQELEGALRELKSTQSKMIDAEKYLALSNLVSGVAHEINTPVGIGITAISFLEEQHNKLEESYKAGAMSRADLEKFMQEIVEACGIVGGNLRKTAKLVEGFKQVAVNQTDMEVEGFNVKSMVETVLMSLASVYKKRPIEIRLICHHDLMLNNYSAALSQVISNLLFNCVDHAFAEKQQGIVTIEFKETDSGIQLIFADNGIGIPEQHQSQVFEPFFTTSRMTGGMGLGLNIVFNLVVHKMEGEVKMESESDKGTRFIMSIPNINS